MTFCKRTVLAVLVLLLSTVQGQAAPSAELWPVWQANVPQSTLHIDHTAWGEFLQKYLLVAKDGTPNLMRYAAVTPADQQLLAAYLVKLSKVAVAQLKRTEQKAYWINLYNALTVKTILDHYPLASIRDIKSGWFSAGPWDLKLIIIAGLELSLNDIEHRILRPIWRDSRIHYAVNCASYSCPSLQPEAFTPENSERLLDQAARDYVNSPRGVQISDNKLVLSSIYDWYRIDFAESEAQLVGYLQSLAAPELEPRLHNFHGTVSYDYDWRLNSADEIRL